MEYQPRRGRSEGHPLLWLITVVVLFVSCAFVYYQVSHRKVSPPPEPRKPIVLPEKGESQPPPPLSKTRPEVSPTITNELVTPEPKPVAIKPSVPLPSPQFSQNPNVLQVQKWLETAQDRPANERVLLERLLAAEREKNATLAIDTIKKLHTRPAMADIQDALMRRLGDLNLQMLFSGQNTPLVTSVIAKRGDSRDRLARENRTTVAAIVRLNPKMKWERLKPGDAVRVLFVPGPLLVIYRRRGYADLSLKGGQFFNRYDVTVKETAKSGTYPISSESSESVRTRFRELGITAQKRAEIEMFLSSGSRIIIAD